MCVRKRRLNLQGRPPKASLVKDMLFEWFCSIKRSVKGRISPAVITVKARGLMQEHIEEHLRRGMQAKAAVVNSSWVFRWRREYGVSFRLPNRKWKVSRSVLKQRLQIGWLNIIRVRRLAQLALHYDMVVEDFDQSPFHMNESGSRGRGTLSLKGAPSVPLKECHAATRERWTANTMTTSSDVRAMRVPPLEVMFKASGGGERMVPALAATIPQWAPWLTVVASPSGSYSETDVLDFMERVLEPMREGRDWRILCVDSFKAQLTPAVRRCAWHRGYVLIVHGGGCTGVVQPNDTDLHQELKKQYCEVEMADMLEQQRLRPRGVPVTRKSDTLSWLAAIWARPELHLAAAAGYKKCGLTNSLDGKEDHLICREAREFWIELQMPRSRLEAVQRVDEEFHAGRLGWNYEDVSRLIFDFPKVGGTADFQPDDEGSEIGGSEVDAASEDDIGSDGGSDGGHGPGGSAVAEPDGPPPAAAATDGSLVPFAPPTLQREEAELAHMHQHRLDVLNVVAEQLRTIGHDRLLIAVDNALVAERRRAHGRGQTNACIAAALLQNQDANLQRLIDGRSLMARLADEAHQRRASLAELRKEQARLEEQRLALHKASTVVEAFNALKSFDAKDFGQGHPKGGTAEHRRARMQVLERLRAKSAPLPADLANDWEWFKTHWDVARLDRLHHSRRDAWGSIFRDIVLAVLDRTKKGEHNALAKWMVQECREYLVMPVLRI